jgi:hypothetical protein
MIMTLTLLFLPTIVAMGRRHHEAQTYLSQCPALTIAWRRAAARR